MKINFIQHLSYSNIKLYEECPRCWYLNYRFGMKLPVPPSWTFGGDVHKAIENYHLKRIIPPEDSILYKYVSAYSKHYTSKDYDNIEEFWKVPLIHPFDKNKKLEVPLLVKLDRVWRGWIHDVKTSSRKYSLDDVDGRTQTALYSYAYRQYTGKEEQGIMYDVLLKGSNPKLDPVPTYADQSDRDNATLWVWNGWKQIVSDFEVGEPLSHNPRCFRKEMLP